MPLIGSPGGGAKSGHSAPRVRSGRGGKSSHCAPSSRRLHLDDARSAGHHEHSGCDLSGVLPSIRDGNGLRAGWLTEPRPLLAQLAITNNAAGIGGSARDGQRLILQGSTDLITWTDLATNLVINNCFSDTEPGTNRVRFYRIKCASPAIGQNSTYRSSRKLAGANAASLNVKAWLRILTASPAGSPRRFTGMARAAANLRQCHRERTGISGLFPNPQQRLVAVGVGTKERDQHALPRHFQAAVPGRQLSALSFGISRQEWQTRFPRRSDEVLLRVAATHHPEAHPGNPGAILPEREVRVELIVVEIDENAGAFGRVAHRELPQARLVQAHQRRIQRANANAKPVAPGDGHAGIQAELTPVAPVNDVTDGVNQRAEAREFEPGLLEVERQA